MSKDLLQRAKGFAKAAHERVNQLYDGKPYFEAHVEDVVRWGLLFIHLIPEQYREQVLAGLYLHDTIEDTGVTYNDIKKEFGEFVADIAFAMTNSTGKTRAERADAVYFNKLRNQEFGDFAKWSDRLANAMNSFKTGHKMLQVHIKEHPHYKNELYHNHNYTYAAMVHELDKILCTEEELNVIDKGSIVRIHDISATALYVITHLNSKFVDGKPVSFVSVINIENPADIHINVSFDAIKHF
jgi:(p)ppGpp synthase/HD superfamily hydrolase